MKKFSVLMLAVAFMFSITSCGGDDDGSTPKDETAPVVNITSPADGATIANEIGIEMTVKATIVDEESNVVSWKASMERTGDVVVSKKKTGDWTINEEATGLTATTASVDFTNVFAGNENELPLDGVYTVTVTATDEAGNIGTSSVSVTVQ